MAGAGAGAGGGGGGGGEGEGGEAFLKTNVILWGYMGQCYETFHGGGWVAKTWFIWPTMIYPRYIPPRYAMLQILGKNK